MITTVIVDDEVNAQALLKAILERHCEGVKVLGTAGSYEEGLAMITELHPDLLFLDIEMPTGSGFELALRCPHKDTKVVFVSAHLDRGAETYQHDALYYVGKPLRISDIQKALAKFQSIKTLESMGMKAQPGPGTWAEQLVVAESTGYRLIPYDQIIYIKGMRNYCSLYLVGQPGPLVVSKSLKEIEALLPYPRFMRFHRSYILHRPFVAKLSRSARGEVELLDGTSIPISSEYLEDVRKHYLGEWVDGPLEGMG